MFRRDDGQTGMLLFRSPHKITVTIKFFGGLDTFAGIADYDPDVGFHMEVYENIRLGKVIKKHVEYRPS